MKLYIKLASSLRFAMRHRANVVAVMFYTVFSSTAWAQFSGPESGGEIYYNGGNVGIGTASPVAKFTIATGGVAIGPLWAISNVEGGRRSIQLTTDTSYGGTHDGHTGTLVYSTMPGGWGTSQLEIRHSTNWGTYASTPDMIVGTNVGIGTTAPQYKLAVNGTIGAKEVVVTNTGWADYVFAPDYRLRSLNEVSEFIASNHHLPDIPSEAEVKENGVSVGEMQAKLLAKIEELTLHMIASDRHRIESDRTNAQQQEQIRRLQKENREIREGWAANR